MLSPLSHLNGSSVAANDGTIGHVKEAYFDDQLWTLRYLVVDTGDWLDGRDVLVSPQSVIQPIGPDKNIAVTLSRAQVEASPNIDTHQPISRRHERDHLAYYAIPEYWGVDGLPLPPPALPTQVESLAEVEARDAAVAPEDIHLRSSAEVDGYDIEAIDDSIGHVADFIVDAASWVIRYLVVDTHNWWPGGKKVLLATRWIDRIDWADRTVFTSLTRQQIRSSPELDTLQTIDRDYEQRLHAAYGRETYWD